MRCLPSSYRIADTKNTRSGTPDRQQYFSHLIGGDHRPNDIASVISYRW
ncbi:hypothetical protein QFZ85_004978 [Pseudomonas frederiksbergensis]